MAGPHRPGYFTEYYRTHKEAYKTKYNTRKRKDGKAAWKRKKHRECPNYFYLADRKFKETNREAFRAIVRRCRHKHRFELDERFMHISRHIFKRCRKLIRMKKKKYPKHLSNEIDDEYWALIEPRLKQLASIANAWYKLRKKKVVMSEEEGKALREQLKHLFNEEEHNEGLQGVVQGNEEEQQANQIQ